MTIKVFYGPYERRPPGIEELPEHIRHRSFLDFDRFEGIEEDFWTDNPNWLNGFSPQNVYLLLPDITIPMSQHRAFFKNNNFKYANLSDLVTLISWRKRYATVETA